MHLSAEEKKHIFETYGQGPTDTGSPESQIALFSIRIKHLTEHLKENHKDFTTARALKALVGQRRSQRTGNKREPQDGCHCHCRQKP